MGSGAAAEMQGFKKPGAGEASIVTTLRRRVTLFPKLDLGAKQFDHPGQFGARLAPLFRDQIGERLF
jgi:hypothetical protein